LGYDRTWKEYVYPLAVKYLNECLDDLAQNRSVGFSSSYLEENSVSFSGNAAWKKLYELFTYLGDYKDSAQHAARFTILREKNAGAILTKVDNMGNTSTDKSYESYTYNVLDQVTFDYSRKAHVLFGCYQYSGLYFFYDDTGRISKVQVGTGNSISSVVTPSYDAAGRMVSANYKTNSYTHEFSYTYDAAGRLIENTVWANGDRYQYTYTYDTAGRVTQMVCWYGYSVPDYNNYRYTTTYSYDAAGFLVKEELVKESYSSWSDTFSLSGTETWVYTNDAQGRPVSAVYENLDRNGTSTYTSQTIEYVYTDLYFYN
jgi:YD repeat-containing protein